MSLLLPGLEVAETKWGASAAAAAEQVAAGQAHTLFLVNPASLDLDKLDSWECETAAEEAAAPSADAAKGGAGCTPPRLAVLACCDCSSSSILN